MQTAACSALVWGPGCWHKFPCKRKAKREVGGKPYCEQHAKMAERAAGPPGGETAP